MLITPFSCDWSAFMANGIVITLTFSSLSNFLRCQRIMVPSSEEDAHLFSLVTSVMQTWVIGPLWTFYADWSFLVCFPIFHSLTSPSEPPEIMLSQSLVEQRQVTPPNVLSPGLWASLMIQKSFPLYGRKALIFPSVHPEMRLLPSDMKSTQLLFAKSFWLPWASSILRSSF